MKYRSSHSSRFPHVLELWEHEVHQVFVLDTGQMSHVWIDTEYMEWLDSLSEAQVYPWLPSWFPQPRYKAWDFDWPQEVLNITGCNWPRHPHRARWIARIRFARKDDLIRFKLTF